MGKAGICGGEEYFPPQDRDRDTMTARWPTNTPSNQVLPGCHDNCLQLRAGAQFRQDIRDMVACGRLADAERVRDFTCRLSTREPTQDILFSQRQMNRSRHAAG